MGRSQAISTKQTNKQKTLQLSNSGMSLQLYPPTEIQLQNYEVFIKFLLAKEAKKCPKSNG